MNILVTRPVHQANHLCQLIEDRGWNAVRFPTLSIEPMSSITMSEQLASLNRYDWVIFVSANAVNFALKGNNGTIARLKQVSIAAVGRATARALEAFGLTVDLLPEAGFNSEALLASPAMQQVLGLNVLIMRGLGGRELLAEELGKRGACVDYCELYKRVMPECSCDDVIALLESNSLHAITLTSGEALQNLVLMIHSHWHEQLLSVPLVVISERIKKQAETMGFEKIVVTAGMGDTVVVETLTRLFQC